MPTFFPIVIALLTSAFPTLKAVPYLGATEPYFLGSGVSGAGGDVDGNWNFLIGPDYTSPCYITNETIRIVIDGKTHDLHLAMHRANKTGLFFGTQTVEGLTFSLVDVTNEGSPWVGRLIKIENPTGSVTRRVQIKVSITPTPMTSAESISKIENGEAIRITFDNSEYCFGHETKNWAARSSLITFNEPTVATSIGSVFELSNIERTLPAGKSISTGLYHLQYYDERLRPTDYVKQIRRRDTDSDLKLGIAEWGRWIDKGKRLNKAIHDPKIRNMVEGCLVACRMQQNRDGGTIAGTRKYANSYIRDTHGGVRLFLASGHPAEGKRAIETIHHKWKTAGFIPNYWSMGSDSFLGRSFVNDSSEITGYYVLMIRDYLAATNDLPFIDELAPSIKFAIDSQLNSMAKNQWRISFNGDETEQYCVREDGQEYGGFPAMSDWNSHSWSFASAAIAVASTQFYIDYLEGKGDLVTASTYKEKLWQVKYAIDETFWVNDISHPIHKWARNVDGTFPSSTVTNYSLIPLWVGAKLNLNRESSDALEMKQYLDPTTGYLPTAPGKINGFCGHNLGYLLYDLKKLKDPLASKVLQTMMNSRLLGCWGTVSEFYGPNGTPNGHNFREFESGIDAEAIIRYFTVH